MRDINYSSLHCEVVTKENYKYEDCRKSWNRAIEKYPLAIIYCKNKEDVKNSIAFARENNIEFRIRSGCHNYEGYSTGNDILVIDVSLMNNINVDEETGTVTIEGGVRNRELYEALGKKGYPFPGGGCPTVGAVAYTLGGGWGYSGRLFGLGCDNLLEVTYIDYNGNEIVANENENEDLFWASKGCGGGNFGVVTSMTFKIPEKIKMATLINFDCPNIDISEMVDLIKALFKEFETLDKRMNLKTAIYNSSERGIGIKSTGLFYGDEKEANKILESIKGIPTKINYSLEYMTVLEANRIIQDSHPDYEKYKSTGRFVCRDYTEDEIKDLINIVKNKAKGAYYAAISFYGLGGAIKNIDKTSSAFYYRDAKFIMGIQSVFEEDKYKKENIEWIKENFKHIEKLTKGSFVNFPYSDLSDYEKDYYGENYKRLRDVRKKYDPLNVFSFEQGIK